MQQKGKLVQSKDIITNSEVRDSGGKLIFGDNILCSQFIRDYVDIQCLKEVMPEDIEDVSDQFVPLFAEERNADRVKRVRLKSEREDEPPFYLISLIEHKTQVEYNVCMQIFRYILYIWEDYEKEMEKKHKGISRHKDFRYPPILPIVYYEGTAEWSAPRNLKSRVNRSEVFGEYIPDFQYYLVPIQKYSNEDLLSKQDEISLIMMINKMRTLDDVRVFHELSEEKLNNILKDSPKHIIDIIADILIAFQLKANVPLVEAEENVGKVREKKVARLFEFADLGDVQAMRRERAELKAQIEEDKKQIEEGKKQIEEGKKQIEEGKKQIEEGIEVFIEALRDCGLSYERVQEQLLCRYKISPEKAKEKMRRYWE